VTTDTWNPTQYNRFREERMQPFFDLVAMVRPAAGMRVIDLGCGTGEITAMLAERLKASEAIGIDSSAAMLEHAAARMSGHLTFRHQDITDVDDYDGYDLVFSHAALQWIPENETLLRRILGRMRSGAQVAVQLPKNDEHPSHRTAVELASEQPFHDLLDGFVRWSHALRLERYAELLYEHGFREQQCIEKIYGHVLPSSADVIEWVKGTMLTAYLSRLDAKDQPTFLAAYRARLMDEIGEHSPYFYPFRRLLFWGQKE
jgi:trans-aconitate 2-methyltransferase